METAGRFTLFSSKIHSNIDSILFVYKTYILYNWSLPLQSVLQCKDRTAISQEAHLYTRIFRGVLRQKRRVTTLNIVTVNFLKIAVMHYCMNISLENY